MNPDFWILWIPFLVLVVMLRFALASLSLVEKKQEIQDEKLDELECQLARLENRLESRFKLPDVDPSTLDKEYMTLDEMEREASRLWVLIGNRDIPDKESILKTLDDALDKLRSLKKANIEAICEMGIMSKKYRRHRSLMEQEEELCRGQLRTAILLARMEFSDWERKKQQEEERKRRLEEREREKDSPEEPPKN